MLKGDKIQFQPALDEVLRTELVSPGSDNRFGLNLIARPPKPVGEQIEHVSDCLRSAEPGQYYYPVADCHLTILDICSGMTEEAVEARVDGVEEALSKFSFLDERVHLHRPKLFFDERAVALVFDQVDQSLQQLRSRLMDHFRQHQIEVALRYWPESAHITLMRYISPLSALPEQWRYVIENAPPNPDLYWTIEEIFLSAGATWYGMQSRTRVVRRVRLK